MSKTLLTLMLIAAQLLAGSRGAIYLCTSNDGNFCCFDAGPAFCNCCHDSVGSESLLDDCCNSHAPHTGCNVSGDDDHYSSAENNGLPVQVSDSVRLSHPCGCSHRLVSIEQGTFVLASAAHAMVVDVLLFYSPIKVNQHTLAALELRCIWCGPPLMCDASFAHLATVVIRC